MAEEIHPSNTDWVLRHENRSCKNQEHLESEQTMNNSGLDTDMEAYSSSCSDSGRVEKENESLSHPKN
ncbi:hypothetical protein GRJ2_001125400 [Grus japonensis]|uniref:Uncharacterized protein n=1 Tax=Grus japonensis TaxID=30415 RepID=A0ABC9WMW2_GRUJA